MGIQRIGTVFFLGLSILFFLVHGFFVSQWAVDVPLSDEWSYFLSDALFKEFSWNWILERHNDHRIAVSKLITWFQYRVDGWNLNHQAVGSYLVFYPVFLFLFGMTMRRFFPQEKSLILLAFVPFFFSNFFITNFVKPFQNCFHLFWIFYLAGVILLFSKEKTKLSHQCLAVFLFGVSSFSVSSGLILSVVTLLVYAFAKVLRSHFSSREIASALLPVVLFVPIAIFFFSSSTGLSGNHLSENVMPWDGRFLSYFFNLIGLGFGFSRVNTAVGLICLLISMIPLVFLFKLKRIPFPQVGAIALWLGVMANLSAIAMGRAVLGVSSAKSPRYIIFVIPLVFLALFFWREYLSRYPSWHPLKQKLTVGFWVVMFITFADQWNMRRYQSTADRNRKSEVCIREYYQGLNPKGDCPTAYPHGPIAGYLDLALENEVSFAKRLSAQER